MKTLIVGDIHGKVAVVEEALAQEHPVVFVGDIADSFDLPVADHIQCFRLIFKAIDEGKATCLYGNHELSYLVGRMRCSGWDPKMAKWMGGEPSGDGAPTDTEFVGGLRHQMATRFDYFQFYEPNILIVHGGLDKTIWDEFKLDLASLPQTLAEWVHDVNSPAYRIGRCRGGPDRVGGLFWCDFDREFTPIPELIQIVGHTRGTTLRQRGGSFCVDYNDYQNEKFYYDLPT